RLTAALLPVHLLRIITASRKESFLFDPGCKFGLFQKRCLHAGGPLSSRGQPARIGSRTPPTDRSGPRAAGSVRPARAGTPADLPSSQRRSSSSRDRGAAS